jgi:hypothetical protein
MWPLSRQGVQVVAHVPRQYRCLDEAELEAKVGGIQADHQAEG